MINKFQNKVFKAFIAFLCVFIGVSSYSLSSEEAEEYLLKHNGVFTVATVDKSGKFIPVRNYTKYNDASVEMNRIHSIEKPHVIITQVVDPHSSGTYTKIIGQPNGGFAQSYPYREGSVKGSKHPNAENTLKIYKSVNLKEDISYIPAHYQLRVLEIVPTSSTETSFVAKVEISGLIGWVDLNKIDLIPKSHMRNYLGQGGINLTLGGYETHYKTPQKPYTMLVKPEYYQVSENGLYNEITFYQYRTYPGLADATSTFGIAADWMKPGIYYSDDHVRYYSDVDRKNPIYNGSVVGDYYSYFQWLPVNSLSLHSGETLRNYLLDVNRSDSIYLNEANSFVENQNKYGMNALLIFAQANLESTYGTSPYALDRNNLFGWGAADSNPDAAHRFASVSDSIQKHVRDNLSDYMNPASYKHNGYGFGNKSSGVTVKYASDPLYGLKIASIAFRTDKINGFKDYNNYNLTKLQESSTQFTSAAGNGSNVYKSKSLPNQIVTNQGSIGNFIKTNRTISVPVKSELNLTKDFMYFPKLNTTEILKYGPTGQAIPKSLVTVSDKINKYTFNSEQALRTDWNQTSHKLTTIPKGTVLNGQPTTNGYVQFSYNKFRGFVKESLLITEVGPNPPNPPLTPSTTGKYIVNSSVGLRLRSEGSSESSTLATIPNGTELVVEKFENSVWGKTTYKNLTGFVHFDYLKKVDEKPSVKYEIGDVNRNGVFDIDDIVIMRNHLYEIPEMILPKDLIEQADINGNGIVDIDDMVRIRNKMYEQ